jgi:hypothetical protein
MQTRFWWVTTLIPSCPNPGCQILNCPWMFPLCPDSRQAQGMPLNLLSFGPGYHPMDGQTCPITTLDLFPLLSMEFHLKVFSMFKGQSQSPNHKAHMSHRVIWYHTEQCQWREPLRTREVCTLGIHLHGWNVILMFLLHCQPHQRAVCPCSISRSNTMNTYRTLLRARNGMILRGRDRPRALYATSLQRTASHSEDFGHSTNHG